MPTKIGNQKRITEVDEENYVTTGFGSNSYVSQPDFDEQINKLQLEDDTLDITYNNLTGVFGNDKEGGELDEIGDQAELKFGADPDMLKGLDEEPGDLSQRYNFQFTSRKDNTETNLQQEIVRSLDIAGKTPR